MKDFFIGVGIGGIVLGVASYFLAGAAAEQGDRDARRLDVIEAQLGKWETGAPRLTLVDLSETAIAERGDR